MALRREQLSPVDGFDNRIDWQAAVDRWNRGTLRWVLGPGFLSCHLTTFALSFLALLTWNLIADPTDLHMIEPFRYWGVIVVFHIILLGGGMIGWKLLRMGETQPRRFTIPAYQLPQLGANNARTPHWQNAWTRSTAAAGRANATARRWASAPAQKPAPPQPVPPPRDAETGWPEVPAMFRSAAVEADTTEGPPADLGAATWPGSAPLSTTLASGGTPNPADEVVSVDHRGAGEAEDDHAKSWIDGFVESRSKDKDQRWSWVEAAAAAWLNRREVEGKTEKALTAGEPESADAAPPPDDADQSQISTD